jgi:hypothetical protein
MKHILNDLTEQEKNAIREQHTGGMKVMTENFSKLINSKLGDSKPLVSEQAQTYTTKGTNSGGQQYDITSPFKVGQTIKGKRSIDGQIYTITVAQVGQGFIAGKIVGPGTYNNQPLKGREAWELNTNTPGVLHGNNEMGTFTIVK